MIVHLVKDRLNADVVAKCGFATKLGPNDEFSSLFTGFDSRVTCVHCKPELLELRKKRRVIIRRKK